MGTAARLLFVVVLFTLASCATSFDKKGRFHRAMSGDTIWTVAKAYRVNVQDLAELNNITDPNALEQGQKLYLPEKGEPRYKKLPFDKKTRMEFSQDDAVSRRWKKGGWKKKIAKDESEEEPKEIRKWYGKFIWPIDGKVTSQFGIRNGQRHDGIDIAAGKGTPIKAADKGSVVFSGKMRGYGNLILVRHDDNFFTAYAHNRKNLARKGKDVKRGELIAEVGNTGNAQGSHLHFEIRHRQKARNPIFFLPNNNESKKERTHGNFFKKPHQRRS